MTVTATTNPASALIASPSPSAAAGRPGCGDGAASENFDQTLKRRLDGTHGGADGKPGATGPAATDKSAETAPADSAAKSADAPADAAEATAGIAPEADSRLRGAPRPKGAEDEEAPATDAAASIAGLPAAIAAILQDLAGRRPAAAGTAPGEAAIIRTGAGRAGDASAGPVPDAASAATGGGEALSRTAGRRVGEAAADSLKSGTPTAAGEASPIAAAAPGHSPAFAAALDAHLARAEASANGPGAHEAAQSAQIDPGPAANTGLPLAAGPATTPATHTGRTAELPVATPVGHDTWADDVGSRVTLLVGRSESKAELVLTPPHLGRIEVSLAVHGDSTTAQFVAATPAARDALEQALPRLREVLQQAGVTLGQTNVGTSGEQQAREQGGRRSGGLRGTGAIGALEGVEGAGGATAARWLRRSDGMVDTFA